MKESAFPTFATTMPFLTLSRTYKALVTISLFFVAVPSFGQGTPWKDSRGNVVPETDARRSVNGEGGWLLITSDDNWREKWDAPSETTPQFTEAHTVGVGKRLHILTFIANPAKAADGTVHVTCDFSMQKPDGTFEMQKKDVDCLTGKLLGSQRTLYLSPLLLGFSGEKGDLAGQWTVRVTIKDSNKQTSIPLAATFEMESSN